MSDASGTVEVASVECPELAETSEVEAFAAVDPMAASTGPGRVRWVELASLVVVLAVIIAVCRGIQQLLGI